ncbi:MAG: ATP-binding cassette domain-containing protein [Gammaproteobacteria bacterium]|nr:ATP-binding cassette domain-containing protein [Gammaproteobacteria bacterium]
MAFVTLRGIKLGFGGPNLLDNLDLQINPGERLCLLGRNGEGKSTLMKMIAGLIKADEGVIEFQQGTRVAYLTQDVPDNLTGTVYDVVASGLDKVGQLLKDYHHISLELAENYNDKILSRLEHIQHELEVHSGWQLGQAIDSTLSRLSLPADKNFSELSGGLKRRVLLARALVTDPQLLLLDEPTNHLDIEAINWLEEFLKSWKGSLLFVTHDRAFLQNLATRIIELDRGRLSSWPGDYANYLEKKQQALEVEARENALFDKKLAQEEVWIRQGIKARRTRNEGRVRALKALREERMARRERRGTVNMAISDQDRSGKIVIEVDDISYSYGPQTIVSHFTTTIMRGDRIGIIGPNGVGKSTLIQLLLGQLAPDQGEVKLGTKLEVAYFDQYRSELDLQKSVRDNLAEGTDNVEINGRSKHVMSYLSDFLFSSQRANSPVSTLSGGERNRLMLAKLFAQPFNLLVMDEPTNDLDVETLELLEELLMDYKGTLLLVSHDRAFLNNVVTSTLVFEGNGQINDYVGGYDDWLYQREPVKPSKTTAATPAKPKTNMPTKKPAKLSYKDQRELDELPKKIEQLEGDIEQLHAEMADPTLYQKGSDNISAMQSKLEQHQAELARAYERWEQLDG